VVREGVSEKKEYSKSLQVSKSKELGRFGVQLAQGERQQKTKEKRQAKKKETKGRGKLRSKTKGERSGRVPLVTEGRDARLLLTRTAG